MTTDDRLFRHKEGERRSLICVRIIGRIREVTKPSRATKVEKRQAIYSRKIEDEIRLI